MRIAQVAPLTEAVPPQNFYGGTERGGALADRGTGSNWENERHPVRQAAIPRPRPNLTRHGRKRCASTDPSRDPYALHMVLLETRPPENATTRNSTSCTFISTTIRFSLFFRQPTSVRDHPARQAGSARSTSRCSLRSQPCRVISISNAQQRPVPQANWVPHHPSRHARETC